MSGLALRGTFPRSFVIPDPVGPAPPFPGPVAVRYVAGGVRALLAP